MFQIRNVFFKSVNNSQSYKSSARRVIKNW